MKNPIYFFIIFVAILYLLPSPYVLSQPLPTYYLIKVKIRAPPGTDIPVNYPIVIRIRDIAAALPENVDVFGTNTLDSADDVDWKALAVLHGEKVIPSQVDDIDNEEGITPEDELAFLTVSRIASGETDEYSIFIALKGAGLPEVTYPLAVRIDEYEYLQSIKEGSPEFMQEAYTMSNGLVEYVIAVKAAWMSGSIFSINLTKTGYDVIKQDSEFMSLLWKWSRFFCPADPGWIENNPNAYDGAGELVFIKEGPVRGIIKLKLESSYHNLTEIYAVFTYILYVNHTWIYAILDITGENAKPGTFLHVNLANREWSGVGKGGKYYTVVIGEAGEFDRTSDVSVPVSEIKEGWYVAYNKDLKKGFGFTYTLEGLDAITWSFIDEGIHNVYTAMSFPFKSLLIPFDESITDDPVNHVKRIYKEYYIAEPTVSIEQAMVIEELPGELAQMKEIFELQKAITELELQIENLTRRITELKSKIEVVEMVNYRTRILLVIVSIILFILGYISGRGHVYRRRVRGEKRG